MNILTLLTLAVLAPLASADERIDKLPPEHKLWIERDVIYIITEREREVFLSLGAREERSRFIEAFWRKRDPNLATPENEFKIEHYRRLEYANSHLGRETFRDGWRTDRGRYYIILGEPQSITRFDGYSELVSSHLWFFQGKPGSGTPSFFYLLFFKRNDFGEYRLYNPMADGPQALLSLAEYTPEAGTERAAYQRISEVPGELAAASLSFDPSEPGDTQRGRASLGSQVMMARIEESPRRAIRTDYADAWMRYGNRVSAEYSFNYVPSRSVFSVLADSSGMALVHFSLEIDPQNFTLETDEQQSKFYTTLDLSIEAVSADGELVLATNKEAYVELTPTQMRELGRRPFAYQDDFPLVPGDFNVTVIVRNRVVTQYTVAESEIHIPRFTKEAPALTDVILAFDSSLVGGTLDDTLIRTYQVGNLRLQPAADNLFVIGDTVHLVTQAFGASPDHKVVFELWDGGKLLKSLESAVTANGVVVDHLKLENMVGGKFPIVARLVSPAGETLSTERAEMTVSPRSVANRPGFVYRRGLNTRIPGLLSFMRGEQLWKLGDVANAKVAFEEALASGNDRLVPARWMLANVHLRENRPDDALALLEPLEEPFPNQFEVVAGLGLAHYLKGGYKTAASYLSRARDIRPPEATLWNALGDSYEHLGDRDKAREAFESSLQLDSEQPTVRERLASLNAQAEKN